MYCRKCGAYMPDQSEFCPSCGARSPQTAEIPVVTVPRRSNTLIIGIIITVTVVIVAAIFGVTWMVADSQSTETEEDGQSLEAAQSQTEAIQEEQEDQEGEDDSTVVIADAAENTETASADTSDAAQAAADSSTAADNTNDDAEASSTDTSDYYYYGSHAAHDDEYYTESSQSDYLWPTDTQYISMSDLGGLSQDTVAAIRNEIYARHGYAFQTERWQNYFAAKSWYHRDSSCTEDTINARLSSIEKANINTIVTYEESMGWR